MQYVGYALSRISLLGNSVNKGKSKGRNFWRTPARSLT